MLPRFGDSSVPKRYDLQLPRLLSVRFRVYAGFCEVSRFVNGVRLGFCKITGFKRYGLTAVMYRGFETVKTPLNLELSQELTIFAERIN